VVPREQTISPPRPEHDDSTLASARSRDDRAAEVKQIMTLVLAPERGHLVEQLVAQGLSAEDAERMGQRAVEGYADCLFETVRKQYEAQGNLNDFLDHAEITWVDAALKLNGVRAAVAPCIATIIQQVGLPPPPNLPLGGSLEERIKLPSEPPPWAAEMESRIRDHVASHSELGVTDVIVECREEGCRALLVGRDIRIFDFDFDVFAEQNGFQKALVGGDRYGRSVWLER
jgi:hypothetical protein